MNDGQRLLGVLLLLLSCVPNAWGDCLSGGPVTKVVTVESCKVVEPYAVPELQRFAERYQRGWVGGAARKIAKQRVHDIMESYKGAVLIGKQEGTTANYFLPSKDKRVCSQFKQGQVWNVVIEAACCDGDPNPPCYLGFNSFIVEVSKVGGKK